MRIYDNGIYRDMTQEELEEFEAHIQEGVEEPTFEERIAALEAAMLEQILGGTTNV